MNLGRSAFVLIGILFGAAYLHSADLVNAQSQSETEVLKAYRYNFVQKFIVANKILFGRDADISLLYAYEPSSLKENRSEYTILEPVSSQRLWPRLSYKPTELRTYFTRPSGEKSTPALDLRVIKPTASDGPSSESPYEAIELGAYFNHDLDCSEYDLSCILQNYTIEKGAFVGTNKRFDRIQYTDIFIIKEIPEDAPEMGNVEGSNMAESLEAQPGTVIVAE